MWVLLTAALLTLSGCSPEKTGSPKVTVDLEIENYRLGNGLEVILRRDDQAPVAAVNLWYHVGAADDGPGRTGFAHLFEHMMLQGSRHLTADPFNILEAAGSAYHNANTDLDRTICFFGDFNSNNSSPIGGGWCANP